MTNPDHRDLHRLIRTAPPPVIRRLLADLRRPPEATLAQVPDRPPQAWISQRGPGR